MEIKFEQVDYAYNADTPFENIALQNVGLSIKKGKINGIVGKSGSGKSTLLQLMNGLLLPTLGEVHVGRFILKRDRKDVNINRLRFQVGLVFQYPEEQFFNPTVYKEILFGMECFHYKLDQAEKHISDALKMVGLDDTYMERDPFLLSNGEKRKVAIASILVFNPKVLVLDEPFVGLDSESKGRLLKLLRMLKYRYHKTIIIVSHDTDILNQIVDYVFVLHDGQIVMEGMKFIVFTQIEKLKEYGISAPKVLAFSKLVEEKKGIRIGYRDDINDLIKDIYRYVR